MRAPDRLFGLVLLLWLCPTALAADELRPGGEVEDEVTVSDPVCATEGLPATTASGPHRSRTVRLRIDRPGDYWLDLHSYIFDAFLALRLEDGKRLTDDDGWFSTHSRLAFNAPRAPVVLLAEVCALYGDTGAFTLRLRRGKPTPMTGEAKEAATLRDAKEAVDFAVKRYGEESREAGVTLDYYGWLLVDRQRAREARPFLERALAARTKVLGKEHADTTTSMHNLGLALRDLGEYGPAIDILGRTVEIRVRTLGENNAWTAGTLAILADAYRRAGRLEEAATAYARGVAISDATAGPEADATGNWLVALGLTLRDLDRAEEAIPPLERAVAIREKGSDPKSLVLASTLGSLGSALRMADRDRDRARTLLQRALDIFVAAEGPDGAGAASVCADLGRLDLAEGDPAGALPLLLRSLALVEKQAGPDSGRAALEHERIGQALMQLHREAEAGPHFRRAVEGWEKVHPDDPWLALPLTGLGASLVSQEKYAEAKPALDRALAMRRAEVAPGSDGIAITLAELGIWFSNQQRYEEAWPLLVESLGVLEKSRGPDDLQTETVRHFVGTAAHGLKRWREALEQHERVLAVREKRLPADDPDVAQSLTELGKVWLDGFDDPARARGFLERAFAIREKRFPADHIVMWEAHTGLGYVLRAQGHFREALGHFEKALPIVEAKYGPDDLKTAQAVHDLGYTLGMLGRDREALDLYRRTLAIREKLLGPDHPDSASARNNVAVVYSTLDRLEEAEALLRDALAALIARDGERSRGAAAVMHNLAATLMDRGRYREAEGLLRRALEIQREVLGPDHVETAYVLNSLSLVEGFLGNPGEARRWAEEATRIATANYGEDHSVVARARMRMAEALEQAGDGRASIGCLERSLRGVEEKLGEEHPLVADLLNQLAGCHVALAEYDRAGELYARSQEIREAAFGPDHHKVGESLANRGTLCLLRGDYRGADGFYDRALRVLEARLGPDHSKVGTVLLQIGGLRLDQGRYEESRRAWERAIEIVGKAHGEDHPRAADAATGLGLVLARLGRFEESRDLQARALAIRERVFGPDHPRVAGALNNLAIVLERLGRSGEARTCYERSLAIREARTGPDHPDTARALENLAMFERSEGNLDRAGELSERALRAFRKSLGPRHPSTSAMLAESAAVLSDAGRWEEARDRLAEALAIEEETLGPENPRTLQTIENLAVALLKLGDRPAAWDLLRRGAPGREAYTGALLGALPETERMWWAISQRASLNLTLWIAGEMGNPDAEKAAYEDLLRVKGRVGRSLVAGRRRLLGQGGAAEAGLMEHLRGVQAEISSAFFAGREAAATLSPERLAWLRSERLRIERDLAALAGPSRDAEPDLRQVADALPEGAVLIDFLVHDSFADVAGRRGEARPQLLTAWVLGRGADRPVRVELGPADEIEGAVRDFLTDLTGQRGLRVEGEAEGRSEALAAAVRKRIWDPLAPHVKGAGQVIVSPDMFLATLPFGVFPLQDGTYLLEHHSFSYLPDAASLALPRDEPGAGAGDLLAVGGVDYHRRAAAPADSPSLVATLTRGGFRTAWTRLPGTESEVEAILDLHEQVFGGRAARLRLAGEQATEERIKAEMPGFGILHLATHAFFEPKGLPSMWEGVRAEDGGFTTRPGYRQLMGMAPGLLSGLVLAGANGEEAGRDDGFLTAEEVAWIDLSRARLVVLSACQTGLGTVRGGEGAMSLTRAFLQAGARTVVSSLWKVRDASTSDLMQSFYAGLLQGGLPPVEALRRAQMEMLTRNRVENDGQGLPSTWGAFILSGRR